jgi:hypothetical protein
MIENLQPRKISAPARIGNAYELRLFALSCLKMLTDRSIEHVRHEDSSFAPVDDVIIEFKDRIECFQAKHAMNPHAILDFEADSGILLDIDQKKFKIEFSRLYEAWKSLQNLSSSKEIIIRICNCST